MSSDTIKTVNLTPQAAADMMGGKPYTKRRGNRTKKTAHSGTTEATSSNIPTSPDTKVIKLGNIGGGNTPLPPPPPGMPTISLPVTNKPVNTPTPVPVTTSSVTSTVIPEKGPVVGGGTVKVELKKKAATKKVQLQPKKPELHKVANHTKKTIKKPRKIILGISSMHRRLTRAKKTHSRVSSMPLDKLKEVLIAKKLIKPTSTAPEAILRQIAADAQIVADKAL